MPPTPKHPRDRFWKHVTQGAADECWEWQGSREASGYGTLYGGPFYPTGTAKAHRLSWEVHNGDIPEGMHVLHHCDNRPCVNPGHLYLGGHVENARDRGERRRGREARQRGSDNRNAKLTEKKVRAIIAELQKIPRRSQAAIAQDFGIKQPQVSRIMRRVNWAHLWDE